jgi:photosystem II stability/assembly factor-like uncharacterized protein
MAPLPHSEQRPKMYELLNPPDMRRLILSLFLFAAVSDVAAQAAPRPDSVFARGLVFRGIGPALMGGRISEIAVAERGRLGTVIYIAAATGGLWRSTNAGVSWTSLFDSVRTPSLGAVAVAPSNADVLWVGTGEPQNMRSSSWGNGVYKSTDGGRTWSAPMLPKSQHIGRIVIDPRDPDVVYVAAVGPLWAAGGERGLYKTSDGGRTWTNTKEISPFTGFTEVVMDPLNPDVLYAASYQRERRAYSFLPAGPETAIWKTTDGARTWTKLTQGLPTGELGRIGLSICRSRPNTVYAVIHARGTTGGTYRSDDAGATWRQTNNVNSTAWFYGQIRCDPTDPDHVIRLAPSSQQSWDGGRTYVGFATAGTHADHHALWINPQSPEQQILGTDGGLYLSWDRGATWDHVQSIPLAQFYAISVDDARPYYNVYGGLQDNAAWGAPNQTRKTFGTSNADWSRFVGGDGFYSVADPSDHNFVYSESQGGVIARYDARTGQAKSIRPVAKPGETHRYNWSAPILPSRHVPRQLYFAANYLFRSNDRGDSWQTVSPDLTRAIDRNVLPMRGAPVDSTALGRHEGTAEFGNISTLDESPMRAGLLATGSDDGVIAITRDGGTTWSRTQKFPTAPETTYVSRVAFSRFHEGTIYASLDGHRSNDFKPYVLKSTDYGRTWTSIAGDLPAEGSVQVVREHHRERNLLFAGTEYGVYFTVDGGSHWTRLGSGIPTVPVHDLAIQERENDLVVGTHGRGIFIIDDLGPLEHLARAKSAAVAHLFPVRDATLLLPDGSRNSGMGSGGYTGQNPAAGPTIAYLVNATASDATAKLEVVDGAGTVVRQLTVNRTPGLHRAVWDMRNGSPLTGPVGTPPPAGGGGGGGGGGGAGGGEITFVAMPGAYRARLTITPATGAASVMEQPFALVRDAAVILTDAELRQLNATRLTVARLQAGLRETQARLDTAQRQLAEYRRAADSASATAGTVKDQITAIETEVASIASQLGGATGRGGGAGGGGGRGGRAGGAGAGRGGNDDDQGAPPTPPTQTISARVGTMNELMTGQFNPSPDQRRVAAELPALLRQVDDRLQRLLRERLPAVQQALKPVK